MDIRVLRYFIATAETENITKAAELLHITQPTLSRQFMDLEEELGHKLFIRSNRKLRLTTKGQLFYTRAKDIVDLCDRTKREIIEEDELAGEIRIAAGETGALKTFARALKRLRQTAPKVRFDIISGAELTVKNELQSGLADLGVFIGTADTTEYSTIKLKSRDTWGILSRIDGPFAGMDKVEAKDLIGKPIICSSQSFRRDEFSAWMRNISGDIHVIGTFNLLYNAYLLAEAGLGHVLALKSVINPQPDSGVMWLPIYPTLEADVVVAWSKNKRLTKPVQLFLDYLRDEENNLLG